MGKIVKQATKKPSKAPSNAGDVAKYVATQSMLNGVAKRSFAIFILCTAGVGLLFDAAIYFGWVDLSKAAFLPYALGAVLLIPFVISFVQVSRARHYANVRNLIHHRDINIMFGVHVVLSIAALAAALYYFSPVFF